MYYCIGRHIVVLELILLYWNIYFCIALVGHHSKQSQPINTNLWNANTVFCVTLPLYAVHFTLYVVLFVLYAVYCPLYAVLSTLYMVHFTLYVVLFVLYAVLCNYMQYILHYMQCFGNISYHYEVLLSLYVVLSSL